MYESIIAEQDVRVYRDNSMWNLKGSGYIQSAVLKQYGVPEWHLMMNKLEKKYNQVPVPK